MADIGCHELFYENLTLGVVRVLETISGVRNVTISKSGPVERGVLSSWEQRYGILLPADLRRFYLAVDGFSLIWDYEYGGRLLPGFGRMHINPIGEVKRLTLTAIENADSTPPPLSLPPPLPARPLTTPSHSMRNSESDDHVNIVAVNAVKAFELDSCRGVGAGVSAGAAKICLVGNGVWLLDRAFEWHPLAKDFTSYFRIMLVHLGLPLWQFRFTSMGLTPWAEQLASLVAPHLLQGTSPMTMTTEGVPAHSQLDPSVFKTAPKSRGRKKDE